MAYRKTFSRVQRRSNVIPISTQAQQRRKSVKTIGQSIFSVIDRYLWLHGIGFKHGISFSRKHLIGTLLSLLFASITEGNFLFRVYVIYINIQSGSNVKGNLIDVVIQILLCGVRILFYSTRKKIDSVLLKFEKKFGRIVRYQISKEQFKLKLILLLFISDFVPLFCKVNYVYTAVDDSFYDGLIPQTSTVAVAWITCVVQEVIVVERAFVALFSSVCFMLKESLDALNARLRNGDADFEYSSKMFLEISASISSTNGVFHPHLLIVFLLLLTSTFRNAYYAVFFSYGDVSYRTQDLVLAFCLFSQFACLCSFGSFVVDAVSNIKATCQVLAHKHSDQRSLHFINMMKDGIEGFKVLSSIIIDKSLILSAMGLLLTYGILIATFSITEGST